MTQEGEITFVPGTSQQEENCLPPSPSFTQLFWIKGKRRWQEICKCLAVIYGNQKWYSRLHLSYTCKKEKASFQNISITGERRQKGSDSVKESKDAL